MISKFKLGLITCSTFLALMFGASAFASTQNCEKNSCAASYHEAINNLVTLGPNNSYIITNFPSSAKKVGMGSTVEVTLGLQPKPAGDKFSASIEGTATGFIVSYIRGSACSGLKSSSVICSSAPAHGAVYFEFTTAVNAYGSLTIVNLGQKSIYVQLMYVEYKE